MPADSPTATDDMVLLHRKGCVCRRCKMNGPKTGIIPKKEISRAEWIRLGKPSTIESYLAALAKASPPPAPTEEMVTLRGSNRLGGAIAPKATCQVPRSVWERLGRPGTTHSYHAALEQEKRGPQPPEPDTLILRGRRSLGGDVALKATITVQRSDWERLGRPSTSNDYITALEREKKTP